MTSMSRVAGCGMLTNPKHQKSPEPSPIELRALRALRRAGSRGMLYKLLRPKMRPAAGQHVITQAIRNLESQGLVEAMRRSGFQSRVQNAWRITDRGRSIVDEMDGRYPPAA